MIENFFDMVIDSSEIDEQNLTGGDVDLINIINPSEETIQKYGSFFLRPLKIGYELQLPGSFDDYLHLLRKNKRKKLQKTINKTDVHVTLQDPLKEETFLDWYEIYSDNINKKERGKLAIGKDWARNKDNVCSIFAYYDGKLLGGVLLKKQSERLSICYTAYTTCSFDLCDLLIAETIKYAINEGFEVLNRGQDTNLYGHHLSPGLYIYKKSLGFKVVTKPEKGLALTRFRHFDKFREGVFFISYMDSNMDKINGNIITDKELERDFNSESLQDLKVYSTRDRIFS